MTPSEPQTDLRAALERHQRDPDRTQTDVCLADGYVYPCDAARALAALDAAESQVAALVEALSGAEDVLRHLWLDGPISDALPDFAASAVLHSADHARAVLSNLSTAATQRDEELCRAAVEAERERLCNELRRWNTPRRGTYAQGYHTLKEDILAQFAPETDKTVIGGDITEPET